MRDETGTQNARILAYSPGRYPILVVEMAPGDFRTLYFETGYDPERSKPVSEGWIGENAVGRHSFVEVSPPHEVPAPKIGDYVRGELLEDL